MSKKKKPVESKAKPETQEAEAEPKAVESDEPKKCFVMMPISDQGDYDTGHFNRVYNHLIQPACELAAVEAVRADDVKHTNVIIIDVLRKIVDYPIAICDLSNQNPNVLYELGIRHAFNMPVVLIKDKKTRRIFDVQNVRTFDYDESLRIDHVNKEVAGLAEVIESAMANSNDLNSILQLLSLQPAKVEGTTITPELQIILDAITKPQRRSMSDVASRFIGGPEGVGVLLSSGQPVFEGDRVLMDEGSWPVKGHVQQITSHGLVVEWDGDSRPSFYKFDSRRFRELQLEGEARLLASREN